MIANYHTHTVRCHHAVGAEREYVENAIRRGLKIFGFADHTPQYFPGDYYSFMRMRPYELPEYCAEVNKLRKEFQDRLQILTGLEAEYYPAIWNDLISRLQDTDVQYLILGQHWLGNEQNEHGSAGATNDETILRRYCHQVCEAMNTGKITYIAHPDLLNYTGDRKTYQRHYRDLCRCAKESDTPLEINFLGIRTNRCYPNDALLKIAAKVGNEMVFGLDSHESESVNDPATLQKAHELVDKFGLKLIEKPFF